jgi:hypothetical protein
MSFFYATENLVKQSLQPSEPWSFVPTENLTAQIRGNKEDRQHWYQNPATKHNFYTPLEAINSTQRVSKDNPPHSMGGCVADYDIKIPAERISEAIKSMDIKPAYFETSLGGNFRLIWMFEVPLLVDDRAFCTFILQEAHDWLRLGLLPGLDRKAFEETSRLYCNGCNWEATGHGAVPSSKVQAFFVECGRKFRFKAGDDELVPLDIVEKALRERYPSFAWPGPFELETQGPSFWIAGSVSPQSAIVKNGGLFTFAAHSGKPFYSWSDILGKEFTDKFQADSIAKATEDIWWDSKRFWRKIAGVYSSLDKAELLSYFKVSCRLSAKSAKSGISPMEAALEHVYNHQRVTGVGPFVFRRPGIIIFDSERRLNTYSGTAMEPATGTQKWGPQGDFPFISAWLDSFFSPSIQLSYFLASLRHCYLAALNFEPRPGQNFFLMGGTGTGKTLCNREVWGASVGGYVDASDFLVSGGVFNAHLMRKAHWALDDDSPAGSAQSMMRVHMMFKKVAANQQFLCNAKYETSSMVEWMGRIGCTTNLDFLSSRIVGPLDCNSLDKTNLFRCQAISQIKFPDRAELRKTLSEELPRFLRHLIDGEPPDIVQRDARYGYAAYHEKTLLDQTHQSSPTASFKEVLIEFLNDWFTANGEAAFWEGTVSMLLRAMMVSQNNELVLRYLKLEQTSRYLEQVQREGSVKSEIRQGLHNTRIWRFYRF